MAIALKVVSSHYEELFSSGHALICLADREDLPDMSLRPRISDVRFYQIPRRLSNEMQRD